ncbi:MAG: SPFH domain-containing protein [Victivallaceae bacterium]|nr:SPFH domain-containing protein [Victivallaceae bacterium]
MSEQPNIFKKEPVAPPMEAGGAVDSGVNSLLKSLRFAFLTLVVIIVGTMIYFVTLGGYIAVPPQEAVIVLKFGAYEETAQRGPHWFFPYPVNEFVHIPTSPQMITVAYMPDGYERDGKMPENSRPWINSGIDGYLLTSDTNIIHTAWSFTYIVTEPELYYTKCMTPDDPRNADEMFQYAKTPPTGRGPQTLLKCLLNEAVTEVTAQMPVDEILTKRSEYQARVFSIFAQSVAEMNLGMVIDNLTVSSIEPPSQTQAAFLEATSAGTTRDTYITEANAFAIRTETEAQSRATKLLADADSYKRQVVSQLRSESIYFNSILAEYNKNSNSTLVALYYDVLGEAMSGVGEKFFLGGDGMKELRLKLNPEIKKAPAAGQPQNGAQLQ